MSVWKNWIDLGSDMCWEDYGGTWGKKAPDGSWYVIRFTNMYDACGEKDCKRDDVDQYHVEVKRLGLNDLTLDQKISACQSSGLIFKDGKIHDESSGVEYENVERVLVEVCITYGFGAPMTQLTSPHRPMNLRARARQFAEECLRDAILVKECLMTPVNKIGSTAEEFGKNDFESALKRDLPGKTVKDLMRKIHGMK